MQTKEVRDQRVDHASNIGGIGEDRGGIPVVAGLTFLMVAVVLFAIGYLFFTAPGPHHRYTSGEPVVNSRITLSDGQRGLTPQKVPPMRTLDENPISQTGTSGVPSPQK